VPAESGGGDPTRSQPSGLLAIPPFPASPQLVRPTAFLRKAPAPSINTLMELVPLPPGNLRPGLAHKGACAEPPPPPPEAFFDECTLLHFPPRD